MAFLKRNKWIVVLILLFPGCASSSYKVLYQDDTGAELSVTPDRILLQCEDLYDADIKGLYGFMIRVLDNDQKVLTFAQSNTVDKEGCEDRLEKIGRILRESKEIYMASRGDLNDRDKEEPVREYFFPKLGKFKSDGRSMEFVAISNEEGLCYYSHGGFMSKPCPPEPFPFWNKR